MKRKARRGARAPAKVRRGTGAPRRRAARVRPRQEPAFEEIVAAFDQAPVAAALIDGDLLIAANGAFARALGLDAPGLVGCRLAEVLPGAPGSVPPPCGTGGSYRTRIDGIPARVDLAPVQGEGTRPGLTGVVLSPRLEGSDTAASRALLALSRDLASAACEEDLTASLSRALELLFPGRSFCIRLLDPKTLALTSLYARGRLRRQAREHVSLRRAAIRKTGLSEAALEAGGIGVKDADEPVFEGCDRATAVPLSVGGVLFGVLHLEYVQGAPGDPESDEPLLLQLANQAALGVRNLRSIEELTFLKTYLEDLIENANALIVVVNHQREILVFNRALSRLTGFARDEALGEEVLSLIPEGERERVVRVLARSLDGEAVTHFETRIALRRGGEARVGFNTAPIYGSSGEVEGIIAIGQDLTLLRAMEERAEHAQKLAGFGQLAAGIVHELNNPLTSITAYSENLISRLGSTLAPGDLEKVRRILEAGQRIQRFSRDLVAYARPSADRMEPVDLAAILDQAAGMCEPVLRQAGARLERHYDAVPPITGNRGSLLQVFVNLVTNAAQSLAPGGTITLTLAPVGDNVVARVADDGCGMTPEVKRRAFEPFFTTKPDGKGSGLGLSIVQGIVERHVGAISVESTQMMGTTFTVTLPRKPPEA